MKNNISIISNDKDSFSISWDEDDYSNLFEIYLIDYNFVNSLYKETDKNIISVPKKDIEDYIGLKVEYIFHDKRKDKKIVVSSSEPFIFKDRLEFSSFDVSAVKSYNGISIGFITTVIYDEFRIYRAEDPSRPYQITEDYLITGDDIKEGDSFFIEAYKKENNELVLKASTPVFKVELKKDLKASNPPKISVIIPVYNSELFISRCIDSILLSTFTDLEILTINDGSKDDSLKILRWYEENYPNIVKVTDKENEGVAFTRSKGIDLAIGEYLAFVDNDDMVHPYMYEKLYNAVLKDNVDVAIAKTVIRNYIGDFEVYMDYKSKHGEDYFIYDYDTMVDISENAKPDSIYFVAIWNKIIRASTAKGKHFDKQNYYEDQAYTRMIYSYYNSFAFCYDAYYIWDKRIRSTKGTQSNGYIANNEDELLQYDVYAMKANLYGFYTGNPERKEQLADLFCRDAYDSLMARYGQIIDNRLYAIYKEEILKINKEVNLLDNKFLKVREDAYNFVKKIVEEG